MLLSRHIAVHQPDWRPALGVMVALQRAGFEPDPRANVSAIDGGGSFADYRGEKDARAFSTSLGAYASELHTMNYQTNWATTVSVGGEA